MSTTRTAREPQQGRSRETVERILAAAEHEIGRLGLAAAGTRGIAARAGLSVGAVYRFFPDKEAIADALARRYLADLMPAYAGTVADVAPGTDLASVVTTLVRQAADLQLAHPGYYRLTEELPPEQGDSPAHQVREQVVDLFAGALRAAGVGEPDGGGTPGGRPVCRDGPARPGAGAGGPDRPPARGRRAGPHGGGVRARPVRLTRNSEVASASTMCNSCIAHRPEEQDMTQTDAAELDRIERSIDIDASAEKVWSLIARPGWWINEEEVDPDPESARRASTTWSCTRSTATFRLRRSSATSPGTSPTTGSTTSPPRPGRPWSSGSRTAPAA